MSRFDDLSELASVLGYSEELLIEITSNASNYYKPFHLTTQKPNGQKKTRHIDNPYKKLPLRPLQIRIKKRLMEPALGGLDKALVGGIKGRKILNHVTPHLGKRTVVCMDLTNCFPNINEKRINAVWLSLGYSNELAEILTKATTYRGYLPQGAPTSSLLCNFALNDMAEELRTMLARNGLSYTQYIDDICFSGDDKIAREMINEVYKITYRYNQKINKGKTEIWDSKHKQTVMGLVVNSRTRIDDVYINKLKSRIISETDRGIISTGVKISLLGQIRYIEATNQGAATYLSRLLSLRISNTYEGKLEKDKGKVRPCYQYINDKTGRKKCSYCKTNRLKSPSK